MTCRLKRFLGNPELSNSKHRNILNLGKRIVGHAYTPAMAALRKLRQGD